MGEKGRSVTIREDSAYRIGSAAWSLAKDENACAALQARVPVARHRLEEKVLQAIGEDLEGPPLVLDDELAVRVEAVRTIDPALRRESPRRNSDRSGAEASSTWTLRSLSRVVPRQVRFLVPGLILLKYLTLVAGIGGLGKSTWLLARAAEGSVADDPWDTIYVSFEDTAEEVLRPRVDAAGGDPDHVHELVLADQHSLASFSLPRDADELQALVRSRPVRLVVIDPIVAAVEAKLDAYKDQHVRQVLARLWQIADEEEIAVALVGHLNRVPSTDAYLRIANSTAFWNAARSVVLITEDGGDDDRQRLVAQRKANLSGLAPVERHVLEEIVLPETLDPDTGQPIVTSRMRFLEVAEDVNPEDVLGPGRTTKTETAEALLARLLADEDWHESAVVRDLLDAAGFNDRLVQRAAKNLRVEVERRGFPAVTWWRLPVAPPSVATFSVSQDVATEEPAPLSENQGVSVPVATSHGEQGTTTPGLGEEGFPELVLAPAVKDGHITTREAEERLALHKFVQRASAS